MKKLCALILLAASAAFAEQSVERIIKIVDGNLTTIRIIYSSDGHRRYTEKVFSVATNGILSEAEMIAAVKFKAGL
jgi:hypothetical protein